MERFLSSTTTTSWSAVVLSMKQDCEEHMDFFFHYLWVADFAAAL